MRQSIPLHSAWSLTYTEYSCDSDAPARKHPARAIAATVPGDAHLDLMRAGLLGDLYVGDNLDHALWMEQKDWWYTTSFPSPPRGPSQRAHLVFHGLDTFGTVWLNGHLLGRTDNMYLRYEFDVTDQLAPAGQNELVVRLASPMYSVQIDPHHQPVEWSPERLFMRKAAMSFGWDIAPRLLTVGIWRPVELVIAEQALIRDVRIRHDADGGGKDVHVQLEIQVEWLAGQPGEAVLSGQVHDAPWQVQAQLQKGINLVKTQVLLREPPLWWPVGYGQPALLDWSASVCAAGRQLDRQHGRVGLRKIELVQQPQPSGARSFFFRCNGRDAFITGLNWTPLDAIFAAVTPRRITATLEALAGVGCNMLRVWGGGHYEDEHFYAECDRLGILIWQDFMMSCGWYPQTEAFAATFDREGRQVVQRLRNHPCIACWSGDNENDVFYPRLMHANILTRRVLAGVCAELDVDRPYVPSSPWSPSGGDPQSWTEGDVHWYAHGKSYRDKQTWDIRCRFMSEFGHLSLPSLELIRRYLPAGSEWPLTSPMWRHHAADTTRVVRFRGAEKILDALQATGKGAPADIAGAVRLSQELQAEAVCGWIEHYSEDPEFGGFMLWNVGDCWPQQSDSVMEYGGAPKLVFARLGELFGRLQRQRRQSGILVCK